MRTYKDSKAMAKSLRASLSARSVLLSHGECLEIVAKQFGVADWNTLSAKLVARSGHPDTPEQVCCSFCGKLQHEVRSLIEGGCTNQKAPSCVFICDECVALCAQINTDSPAIAGSPQDPAIR
jgi:hypothetical protein